MMPDRRRRADVVDGMHGGTRQKAANENVDCTVQGRGEQHPLTVGRSLLEQSPDHGQEAKVSHVIGLVDYAHLDVTELAMALLHQVG